MARLLFVDDDRFFGRPYVESLMDQLGPDSNVDICTRIDDAIHYVHEHHDLQAIVLDVMMPPPEEESYLTEDVLHATEEGFATGIWFLRLFRKLLVDRAVRVFVLTNRDFEVVRNAVAAIGYPAGQIECERKLAVSAAMLPSRVKALLNRALGG